MKIKINYNIKYSYTDFLFFCAYFFVCLGQSFGIGGATNVINISVTLIGIMFGIIKMLRDCYTLRENGIIFVFLVYGLFTFLISKDISTFLTILFILSAKNVNIKKIIGNMLVLRIIAFIMIIIASQMGYLKDTGYYLFKNGINTYTIRHSLGFYHPNSLAMFSFVIIAMYFIVRKTKIFVVEYLVLSVFVLLIYLQSYSRTGLLCSFCLIILFYFNQNNTFCSKLFNNKWIYKIPFFICIISVVMILLFSVLTKQITQLDLYMSGRFSLAHTYFNEYGLSLFGTVPSKYYVISGRTIVVDSAYAAFLIKNGIIGFALLSFALYKFGKIMYQNRLKKENLVLLCFALYGISEQGAMQGTLNFILILISILVFTSQSNLRKGMGEKT